MSFTPFPYLMYLLYHRLLELSTTFLRFFGSFPKIFDRAFRYQPYPVLFFLYLMYLLYQIFFILSIPFFTFLTK
jgi:hypothetical protein